MGYLLKGIQPGRAHEPRPGCTAAAPPPGGAASDACPVHLDAAAQVTCCLSNQCQFRKYVLTFHPVSSTGLVSWDSPVLKCADRYHVPPPTAAPPTQK